MKICPNCGAQLADTAMFCGNCGTTVGAPTGGGAPVYAPPAPMYDPYDHTSEFEAKDISENKIIAMLVYLMGWLGILIALLAAPTSKYAAFHLRQALKFTVVEILMGLITAFTFWTIIVPIVAGVMYVVLFVIKIIAFFQICSGKAKEPAIIRSLGFLR